MNLDDPVGLLDWAEWTENFEACDFLFKHAQELDPTALPPDFFQRLVILWRDMPRNSNVQRDIYIRIRYRVIRFGSTPEERAEREAEPRSRKVAIGLLIKEMPDLTQSIIDRAIEGFLTR